MVWVTLFLASLFEIGFAIALKQSKGLSVPVPAVLAVVCAIGGAVLLGLALKKLPVGLAYAAWTGMGAAGTALIGIIFLGESSDALKLVCIGLIIAAVAGLELSSDQ